LIVPNLADHFFSEVAHKVQQAAIDHGYLVWVAASNSHQDTELSLIRQMKQHQVDGILLIPTPGSTARVPLDKTPMVTLDRPLTMGGVPTVLVENRGGSRKAVDHLLGHGYQGIVCISNDARDIYTSAERMLGYEDAMRDQGLPSETVTSQQTLSSVHRTLKAMLARRKPPEAIFTTNNLTTVHVVEALQLLGISIPDQLALVGFDDFELARFLRPGLTVVCQPAAELGRQAARLLFDRLTSADAVPITISLPVTLIVRSSCGCSSGKELDDLSLMEML